MIAPSLRSRWRRGPERVGPDPLAPTGTASSIRAARQNAAGRIPERSKRVWSKQTTPGHFLPSEAALRGRRPGIEKLGNGGDKLRWCERFGEENAVGNTIRGPLVGICRRHVDDGEGRVDLPGVSRDFPAVHLALPQIDVRDQCAVFALAFLQQGYGLFAGWCDGRLKAAIGESGLNDALN